MGFLQVFPEDSVNLPEDVRAGKIFTKVVETSQKIDVPNYRHDVFNPDTKVYEIQ
jgi:two-component system sensor histidine kinase VicK